MVWFRETKRYCERLCRTKKGDSVKCGRLLVINKHNLHLQRCSSTGHILDTTRPGTLLPKTKDPPLGICGYCRMFCKTSRCFRPIKKGKKKCRFHNSAKETVTFNKKSYVVEDLKPAKVSKLLAISRETRPDRLVKTALFFKAKVGDVVFSIFTHWGEKNFRFTGEKKFIDGVWYHKLLHIFSDEKTEQIIHESDENLVLFTIGSLTKYTDVGLWGEFTMPNPNPEHIVDAYVPSDTGLLRGFDKTLLNKINLWRVKTNEFYVHNPCCLVPAKKGIICCEHYQKGLGSFLGKLPILKDGVWCHEIGFEDGTSQYFSEKDLLTNKIPSDYRIANRMLCQRQEFDLFIPPNYFCVKPYNFDVASEFANYKPAFSRKITSQRIKTRLLGNTQEATSKEIYRLAITVSRRKCQMLRDAIV